MSEDKLTKDDLVLLMESYRNMITMHQTILDQSSKTIDKLDGIATKQDNLFSKQSTICSTIQGISSSVNTAQKDLKDAAHKIDKTGENIKNKIDDHEKQRIESDNTITGKIHMGWIGMITIIIGLIGLLVTISQFIHTHPTLPMP